MEKKQVRFPEVVPVFQDEKREGDGITAKAEGVLNLKAQIQELAYRQRKLENELMEEIITQKAFQFLQLNWRNLSRAVRSMPR